MITGTSGPGTSLGSLDIFLKNLNGFVIFCVLSYFTKLSHGTFSLRVWINLCFEMTCVQRDLFCNKNKSNYDFSIIFECPTKFWPDFVKNFFFCVLKFVLIYTLFGTFLFRNKWNRNAKAPFIFQLWSEATDSSVYKSLVHLKLSRKFPVQAAAKYHGWILAPSTDGLTPLIYICIICNIFNKFFPNQSWKQTSLFLKQGLPPR